MSDSEKYSNRPQLYMYLITLLINFSFKLGHMMTRYDFLCARRVILSNVWTDLTWPNFDFGQLCICIGVNRWIFWKKSPNVVLTKIQNLVEIQSSRFRWYSFVFARTQSRLVFSSAVPSGSGAFQMPTRPSSSSSSSVSASSSAASTLRGGRANLRNASVTFSLFWHEASLGWH